MFFVGYYRFFQKNYFSKISGLRHSRFHIHGGKKIVVSSMMYAFSWPHINQGRTQNLFLGGAKIKLILFL